MKEEKKNGVYGSILPQNRWWGKEFRRFFSYYVGGKEARGSFRGKEDKPIPELLRLLLEKVPAFRGGGERGRKSEYGAKERLYPEMREKRAGIKNENTEKRN